MPRHGSTSGSTSKRPTRVDRANRAYVDKFYRPFTDRKLFPQMLHFSTTPQAIALMGLQAGGENWRPRARRPPVIEGADMSLRLHESAVNNSAFDALAGRTVYEEKVQATVTDTLGHLPEKMKGDEDGQPWAITFAPRQPISVTFADDGFKITIRGVQFQKGNDAAKNMNISAAYKIEQTPAGLQGGAAGQDPGGPHRPQGRAPQQVTVGVLLEKAVCEDFRARDSRRGARVARQMEGGRQAHADPSRLPRRLVHHRLETLRRPAESGCRPIAGRFRHPVP